MRFVLEADVHTFELAKAFDKTPIMGIDEDVTDRRVLEQRLDQMCIRDSRGTVLPYVAMMLAVIIGLAALAIDGSRLMSVQTQLQNAADALALAGATELDRRPDSIIRAEAAIRGLIANPITGAGIEQVAEVSSVDFLRSLPPSDDLPITTANLTDDPTLAAYVQVTVKPVTMLTIFPISLLSGRRIISVSAQSVAGYDQVSVSYTHLSGEDTTQFG